MSDYFQMEAHRRSYLPLCAFNIVVSCLSIGFSLWVVLTTYLAGLPILKMERFLVVLGFLCVGTAFHCNFMIAMGKVLWLKISVGVLVFCILIVVPAIGYRLNLLVYACAVLFSLIGLFSFNSNRHRQFCMEFRAFRHQRASAHEVDDEAARIELGVKTREKRKMKTSRREIAINNRLRDRAAKAALRQRQKRNRVTYPIGALVILLFIGLLCYSIYDSLMSGVAFLLEKSGPIKRYSVTTQPGSYWFAITIQVFMVVMGVWGLSAMLYCYKLESRK